MLRRNGASSRVLSALGSNGDITGLTNYYDSASRVIEQDLADGVYQYSYAQDSNGKIVKTDLTSPHTLSHELQGNVFAMAHEWVYFGGKLIQKDGTYVVPDVLG